MLYIKNLYEGGSGWTSQCAIRFANFMSISFSESCGVAVGPMCMPKYLPLVCDVSIDPEEIDAIVGYLVA